MVLKVGVGMGWYSAPLACRVHFYKLPVCDVYAVYSAVYAELVITQFRLLTAY